MWVRECVSEREGGDIYRVQESKPRTPQLSSKGTLCTSIRQRQIIITWLPLRRLRSRAGSVSVFNERGREIERRNEREKEWQTDVHRTAQNITWLPPRRFRKRDGERKSREKERKSGRQTSIGRRKILPGCLLVDFVGEMVANRVAGLGSLHKSQIILKSFLNYLKLF